MITTFKKRASCVFTLEFPPGTLLPWVILGQYCAYVWNSSGSLLTILSLFITSTSWRLWPFLLGFITAFIHYFAQPNITSITDASVLIRLSEPPRHPLPGEVKFTAFVIKALDERAPVEGTKLLCKAIDLPWRNSSSLSEGDTVAIRGDFSPVPFTVNPFSYEANLRHDEISAKCKARFVSTSATTVNGIREIKEGIIGEINEVGKNSESAGLLLSLLIGARDVVTLRTEKAFRAAGLSHLLVASGYQVTLIFGLIVLFLKFFLVDEKTRLFVSLIAAWIFVAICGFDSSVKRAGVGLSIFVICTLFSRKRDLVSVTLCTIFFSLLIWPGSIFDPGFELSIAALFGIALGDAPFRSYIYRYFSVSIYATLFAASVALLWFGDFSPISFLLNILLPGVVSPVACIGGIVGLMFSFLSITLPLEGVIYLVSLLRDFVIWIASFGFAAIEVGWVWRIVIAVPCLCILSFRLMEKVKEFKVTRGID